MVWRVNHPAIPLSRPQYYLVDDTLEVREVSRPNDGRDPFPVLVTRHRVPRDPGSVPSTFPRSVLELTEQEVAHYLTPADFSVGKTVTIYSRRFLVYDVDDFTRAFYWKNFGTTDFTPIDVEAKKPPVPKMVSLCGGGEETSSTEDGASVLWS